MEWKNNHPKLAEMLDKIFWDNKYKENNIGWDVGKISTPLKEYFDQLTNKDLNILIPGGGNSYEAEYLHHLGFKNVYVVDFSKTALTNIQKRVPSFPSKNLIQANFFDLNSVDLGLSFDLIIEQTFFCAIAPSLRSKYAIQAKYLLAKKGKLVGLLFNDTLYNDRPPYGGNKKEYLNYFKPYFKIQIMSKCYNSIKKRDGRELFIKLARI